MPDQRCWLHNNTLERDQEKLRLLKELYLGDPIYGFCPKSRADPIYDELASYLVLISDTDKDNVQTGT